MKPILIDALHICMGGGLMILNHLVSALVRRNIDFYLLKDSRCPRLTDESKITHLKVLSADSNSRRKFYKENRDSFSKVLCFGNIPPLVKLPVPVYTYIHNVSLLKIPRDYSFKAKIKSALKKHYIRHFAPNTDAWIVQTSNTAQLVRDNLSKKNQPIHKFPFYYIPAGMKRTNKDGRRDYCFIGDHTSAKGHEYLVDAWIKLARQGVTPKLHLTVSECSISPMIRDAHAKGARIVNHGKVPFSEVVEIYNLSKAVVYPSLNESLGLGIVEGIEAGCDVIGADLPYMHAICKPSCVFEPCNSDSIVDAILSYEASQYNPTSLLIHDTVNEFIDFLIK